MNKFNVIIVEDVMLELRGTVEIFKNEIPEANIIGTAQNEEEFWELISKNTPDLVLLDLGLGGSTTVGIDICRKLREKQMPVKILIFTGEVLNEKLWVDALDAGADGVILKTGELLTKGDVNAVMDGKRMVFNQPILEKILQRFRQMVTVGLLIHTPDGKHLDVRLFAQSGRHVVLRRKRIASRRIDMRSAGGERLDKKSGLGLHMNGDGKVQPFERQCFAVFGLYLIQQRHIAADPIDLRTPGRGEGGVKNDRHGRSS